MRRVFLIAGSAGLLVACGAGSTKTEVFRPTSPLVSDLYLQVRGSSGAVTAVEDILRHAKQLGGFIVAPKVHGQEDCTITRTITSNAAPAMRKYEGQKVTVWVYGNSSFAPSVCKGLSGIGGG